MGGLIIVVAIIVIVCYIMWRKNQNKNTPREKKSIEAREKTSVEKIHKEEKPKDSENSLKTSHMKEDNLSKNNSTKSFEKQDEQKYDGSRKKDRAKKRREKRKTDLEEVKKAPANKSEDKKLYTKAEKVEKTVEKVEPKVQAKAVEKVDPKVQAKAEKVEPKIEEAKEKVNEPIKKPEPKVDKVDSKLEAKENFVKPAEKTESKPKKVYKPIEKLDLDIDNSKEIVNNEEKKIEQNPQVKEDFVKSAEKTESKLKKVYKPIEKLDLDIGDSKEIVNKEKKINIKAEAKENLERPAEKNEGKKIISTNEKYKDLISGLNENPWDVNSEKINVKLEDLKGKKASAENYSLDEIKKSLTRENLSEFLNSVKTNPTILKRKDKVTYEFTTKKEDEIKKIAERYSLSPSNFEKASSLITVDKESSKLLELTDILSDKEKRFYFETKF